MSLQPKMDLCPLTRLLWFSVQTSSKHMQLCMHSLHAKMWAKNNTQQPVFLSAACFLSTALASVCFICYSRDDVSLEHVGVAPLSKLNGHPLDFMDIQTSSISRCMAVRGVFQELCSSSYLPLPSRRTLDLYAGFVVLLKQTDIVSISSERFKGFYSNLLSPEAESGHPPLLGLQGFRCFHSGPEVPHGIDHLEYLGLILDLAEGFLAQEKLQTLHSQTWTASLGGNHLFASAWESFG